MTSWLDKFTRFAATIALNRALTAWRARGGPNKSVTFGAYLVNDEVAQAGFRLPLLLEALMPDGYRNVLTCEINRQANEFIELNKQRPFVQILYRSEKGSDYVWYATTIRRVTGRLRYDRP